MSPSPNRWPTRDGGSFSLHDWPKDKGLLAERKLCMGLLGQDDRHENAPLSLGAGRYWRPARCRIQVIALVTYLFRRFAPNVFWSLSLVLAATFSPCRSWPSFTLASTVSAALRATVALNLSVSAPSSRRRVFAAQQRYCTMNVRLRPRIRSPKPGKARSK